MYNNIFITYDVIIALTLGWLYEIPKKFSYDINMIYISRNTHNQTYLKKIPFMDL